MTDTWRYDRVDPMYGEMVVFRVPNNLDTKYVKRVVGVPGDRIEIRDDALYRNGEAMDERYLLLTPNGSDYTRNFAPAIVPERHYFVLGDNRHNSHDSRFFGTIDRELVHGRVEHRWFAYDGQIRWDRFPEVLAADDP